MSRPLCQYLEWDSAVFGFRIARAAAKSVSGEDWREIRRWCGAERIRCLYLLTALEDLAWGPVEPLGAACRLVDVRVTLDCEASPRLPRCRAARESDRSKRRTSRRSKRSPVKATSTRVSTPIRVSQRSAAALSIRPGLRRAAGGYASAVLVAGQTGKPSGYITCDWSGETGRIGLIAVAPWARGAGLGRALVRSSLGLFQENGVRTVTVVTQGRNIQAQRLYQKCGFLARAMEFWRHCWF